MRIKAAHTTSSSSSSDPIRKKRKRGEEHIKHKRGTETPIEREARLANQRDRDSLERSKTRRKIRDALPENRARERARERDPDERYRMNRRKVKNRADAKICASSLWHMIDRIDWKTRIARKNQGRLWFPGNPWFSSQRYIGSASWCTPRVWGDATWEPKDPLASTEDLTTELEAFHDTIIRALPEPPKPRFHSQLTPGWRGTQTDIICDCKQYGRRNTKTNGMLRCIAQSEYKRRYLFKDTIETALPFVPALI